jgi:hypothetical protein
MSEGFLDEIQTIYYNSSNPELCMLVRGTNRLEPQTPES